jgi:hypothetical protein
MSAQYIINAEGQRISAVLPIAEYEALLRYVPEDETAFLLREPNGTSCCNGSRISATGATSSSGSCCPMKLLIVEAALAMGRTLPEPSRKAA